MAVTDPASYLRTLPAIRERTRLVMDKAEVNQLTNFDIDFTKFNETVEFVASIIQRDFAPNYSKIPPHGRWQHFDVGGVSRIQRLVDSWSGVDDTEIAKRLVDLFLVSVLLDAGAGNKWVFSEPGNVAGVYGRSEGLAVASLYLFMDGLLSSNPSNPYQVDSTALKSISVDTVSKALQHSSGNPLAGMEGRAELLQRLGYALEKEVKYFGPDGRPGYMLEYLLENSTPSAEGKHTVSVATVWDVIMTGLNPIWPKGRTALNGVSLGDAWPCSSMPQDGEEWETIVPFHKLSQWLCYSILVPLERYGNITFAGKELQTGLPEYRNGGLFVDTGVLILKPEIYKQGITNNLNIGPEMQEVPVFPADEDVIVEWRALTVGLLDLLLPAVNERLGIAGTTDQLILAQLLEAGSWKGGREIAAKKRPEKLANMYQSRNSRNNTAVRRLMTEYKQLINEAPDGISAGPIDEDNFFEWECLIQGPEDTPFEGGVFPATLTFPKDYPLSPPAMKFTCDMFHPNGKSIWTSVVEYIVLNWINVVYKDGTVCISILHAPGDDPNMYESASERWSPIQSVEKILISVMSMLAEPNDESGANIDACKVWRNDRAEYNRMVKANVRKTLGL
ncbi:uncharacterized protein V1513DRAFT_419598 [Lipomyces chichibuensis]|uniref:uncharacterized protein n=1 Tax=Lipomyces chichibuensis TaxID=1546026 RepID=UPI00334381EA